MTVPPTEIRPEIPAAGNSERVRRAALLEQLKELYIVYPRLGQEQKPVIKAIKSLERGFDGAFVDCCFCRRVGSCETDMTVHHKDGNPHNNQLDNLDTAHGPCNRAEFNRRRAGQPRSRTRKYQISEALNLPYDQEGVSVRVPQASEREGTETQAWTSTEGERHDKARPKFDKLMLDVINGPFSIPPNKRKESPGFRQVWVLDKLARYCVNVPELLDDGVKLSSVTFKRWIREDGEGYGPFYIDMEQKPYKVHLKERLYQEQCKKAGLPEEEYLVKQE